MSSCARHCVAGRSDRLRRLAARLYRLSDDAATPSSSHTRAERLIDEAEVIALELRREFR